MNSKAPIPRVVRTPLQLLAARRALGLSEGGLARMIEAEDPAVVTDWESGSTPIPRPLTQLLEFCMELLMQREELDERLETLVSGERLCGGFVCSNAANDITQAEIANAMVAKTMNDVALAKLMRQPVSGEA
jgi:hypothetical protein